MKTFKSLIESLAEAWPGTPEYKKKFGSPSADGPDGSRHKIDRTPGITRATRKYDAESGESEEPTKSREDAAAAPAKRGRGRPPGKYGSYKKKVKESLEILEALETDEEISEFVDSLDEESFAELQAYLSEDTEQIDELSKDTLKSYKKKATDSLQSNVNRKHGLETVRTLMGRLAEPDKNKKPSKGGYKTITQVARANDNANVSDGLKKHMPHMADKINQMHKELQADRANTTRNINNRKAGLDSAEKRLRSRKYGRKYGKNEEFEYDLNEMHTELEEALKGAMHPDAGKVLKHIKPEHHSTYTPYLKKGVYKGNYADRASVLSAAEKAGHVKEDYVPEEVDEALKHPNHKVLDKNRNNRLDKEDFAMLRGEKKAPVKETSVESVAAFLSKQAKGEA